MHVIRKKFTFEAAHVLESAESKDCLNLHGHSYEVEVTLSRRDLNSDGMVEDFKIVKEAFSVINALDHSIIVKSEQQVPNNYRSECIELRKNPTAENIAEFIYDFAKLDMLSDEVQVTSIAVQETKTGCAVFYPNI